MVKMFDHAIIAEEISVASWSTASSDTTINDWSPEPEIDSSDLQPAVVLQRLSPSVWSSTNGSENDVCSTDSVMQPVVMLERLPSIPMPSSEMKSFHEENATSGLKACAAEPTVVLQRLSPFFQNSYANFSTKEMDHSIISSQDIPVTSDTLPSSPLSTAHADEFNSKEADNDLMSAEFPVTYGTWSSSSSSTGQSDVEEQNYVDTFIKQPVIVLEQLPQLKMPSNEVTVGMS